ncbi:MAG: hypothetical protein IT312_08410 [Anaerolineales bacterium]|nr:hypothetical protein [Anaerolineales bacterium]
MKTRARNINTIEMTRKIRAKNAKKLKNKSRAERIAYYRERAKNMEKKVPELLKEIEKV